MAVAWIKHRFAGGALALDVANTVVLRADPQRSFDRFNDAVELRAFAEAAMIWRADELAGRGLRVDRPKVERARLTELRETTDALFRASSTAGALAISLLPPFLKTAAECIDAIYPQPAGSRVLPLDAATALSAIALLAPEKIERIRICDNCGWLFLDGSRNGSRRWCDMTVCGNRRKAQRHYERRKAGEVTP